MHIIVTCPSIAVDAYQLCLTHIHQSRDPSLYQNLLAAYEQANTIAGGTLPDPLRIGSLDTKWADEVAAKNAAERNKLEVELKTYTGNMIKESIRVSPRLLDIDLTNESVDGT